MRKAALTLLAAAGMPLAAHGQTSSVTLYGIIDAGVEYARYSSGAGIPATPTNAGNPTGASGSALRVSPGIQSQSRIGLRGTEDLGSGLRGVFQLEMGILPDTGAFLVSPGSGGVGFGRRAVVGVEGAFGQVLLGRDYVPTFWFTLATDRMKYGLYGSLQYSRLDVTSDRISNGITYLSPKFGGFTVRAGFGAGNENFTAPRSQGRYAGVALEYEQGPLYGGIAYSVLKAVYPAGTTQVGDTRQWGFGARYDFAPFSINGGGWLTDPAGPDTPASARSAAYWLGAGVKVGTGEIVGQAVRTRVTGVGSADRVAITYGVAYLYPLSRRTNLYVAYGGVRNNATSSQGLINSSVLIPAGGGAGSDINAVAFGVRQVF